MESNYVQMFDVELGVELVNDMLIDGKLNIRNEFLRKVYLFLILDLIIVMLLGMLSSFLYCVHQVKLLFWIFLALNQILQFYFQHYGKIDFGNNGKIYHWIIGSLSIVINSFSYFYILTLIDGQQSFYQKCSKFFFHSQFFGKYARYLFPFTELFVVILILMAMCNLTENQMRSHVAWLVPLITPYFFLIVYFFFFNLKHESFFVTTLIITWLCLLIVMMTQKIKTKQENYEAMFINSCRLLGAPFQILVYVVQFASQSRRNDNLLFTSTDFQKIQYLRKTAALLSTITLILVLLLLSQYYDYQENNDIQLQKYYPPLVDALYNYKFQTFFWISICLSLIFYPLTFIVRNYHQIILWTLFFLQITFYSICLLGLFFYAAFSVNNSKIIMVSICAFNSIFLGLVAYTFLEIKSFQVFKAFLYMSTVPFMIFFDQLIFDKTTRNSPYAYTFGIFVIFEIYAALILLELHLNLNQKLLQFKLQDYCLEAMIVYEPIFGIVTRAFNICIQKNTK